MEQVKTFDMQLKKVDYDKFVMSKLLYLLMSGCAALLMIIPIEKTDDMDVVHIVPLLLYGMAAYYYLMPYMVITEKGRMYTIYEKLRYVPVSKKEIRTVRMGYLRKFCIVVCVINLIAGQLGMLTVEGWRISSVIYPALVAILVWLMGLSFVYVPGLRRKRR